MLLSFVVLALWMYGPLWVRPYLIVFGVVFALVTLAMLWRYVRDDRREMAQWPSRSEYRWPPGWGVQRYHRALLTWLKVDDWRIIRAEAVDNDRLLLCVHRDRHRLPVLLLRPGLLPDDTQIAYLRDVQRRDDCWEAALISDRPSRFDPVVAEDNSRVLVLNYEALPLLNEALDYVAARHSPGRPEAVAAA